MGLMAGQHVGDGGSRRIAVIGTVMHDRVRTVEGREYESLGGILYNLLALAGAMEPGWRVRPYAFLGAEHRREALGSILDGIAGLESDFLRVSAAGSDSNIMEYRTTSSRGEKKVVNTPPFAPGDLGGLAECDAAIVNFISGHELDFEAFLHIRRSCPGLLYLDAHNLGKKRIDGVAVPGHVFEEWPQWVREVDVVQANEWEVERFFGAHPETEADYRAAVESLLVEGGPRAAIVTLGPRGVAVGWRVGGGGMEYRRIPAMPVDAVVDTTGCGDSFSAGFVVEYLRSGSPLRAAVLGSTLSGLKCRHLGLAGMRRIDGVEEAMRATYGGLLEASGAAPQPQGQDRQ